MKARQLGTSSFQAADRRVFRRRVDNVPAGNDRCRRRPATVQLRGLHHRSRSRAESIRLQAYAKEVLSLTRNWRKMLEEAKLGK